MNHLSISSKRPGICRLCRDDLSKLDDEGYTPRWIKMSQSRDKKICYVPGCSAACYKVTKFASKATLNQLFDTPCENESPLLGNNHDGCPLCQEHYGVLYRHLNPTHFTRNCKTCNKLLHDLTKTRKWFRHSGGRTLNSPKKSNQMIECAMPATSPTL